MCRQAERWLALDALGDDHALVDGELVPRLCAHDQPRPEVVADVHAVFAGAPTGAVLLFCVCIQRVSAPAVSLPDIRVLPLVRGVRLSHVIARPKRQTIAVVIFEGHRPPPPNVSKLSCDYFDHSSYVEIEQG